MNIFCLPGFKNGHLTNRFIQETTQLNTIALKWTRKSLGNLWGHDLLYKIKMIGHAYKFQLIYSIMMPRIGMMVECWTRVVYGVRQETIETFYILLRRYTNMHCIISGLLSQMCVIIHLFIRTWCLLLNF